VSAVVVVLAVIAGGFVLTRLLRDDAPAGPWHKPLWSSWSAGSIDDACTVGVCVGDTVALPLGRPVEAVADLPMPEELGALSLERVWLGERAGLFGTGWATVWDVRLVDGKFVGPLPATPVEAPRRGHEVKLEAGATVHVDDQGRLDEVCLDAAACTEAEWSDDALVLRSVLGSTRGEDTDESPAIRLSLDDGVVTRAKAGDGRKVEYLYESGRLATVTRGEDRTAYGYESGRLASIDDGVRRTYSYDSSGLVDAVSDLDGGAWTITPPSPAAGTGATTAPSERTFEVKSPEGWTRTYRFTRGLLVEVDDSDLGVMLRREIVGGRIKVEEHPLEGVRSERVGDDELQVDQQQGGGPVRSVRYWFDDSGRVTRTDTADGSTRVDYEGSSERPAKVEGPDGTQTFDYDRNGLLVATEDADGYRVEVKRNEQGQPLVVTDGVQRTEFAYDSAGRVDQQRSGETTSSATYGADGMLASLTSPTGAKLDAAYDDRGRLQTLGSADTEPTTTDDPSVSKVAGSPAKTVKRSDGRYEQRYASGETVVLDDGGHPVEVTVDGRTETRRYDKAGRVVELDLPGGPTYKLTYTPAGRVASVTDGTVKAELSWHGNLLVGAETSAGSSYQYDYNDAGQMVSAVSGPLRWDYSYDKAGRSSVVRGPSGVVRSRWDERGRPDTVTDGGHTEQYQWDGKGLDLAQVDIDDEEVLSLHRNDAGQVDTVTTPDSGTAEMGYDPDTGALDRYQVGDADELTLHYDGQGQVDSIKSGGRTETWTWSDGKVVRVDVDGEKDPYKLRWLAPGLLGDVKQGDDHLLRTKVDDAGRPTKLWSGDDLAGTLAWDDTGLAKASIEDGPSATFDRDDEHRPVSVKVDDDRVDWTYKAGALTSFDDGDQATSFGYRNGRLHRTTLDDGDEQSTINWDPARARPEKIDTPEGVAAFEYGNSKVESIRIDGEDQKVRYEDDEPSAKGDAGDLLDALFNDTGQYQSTLGQSTLGPAAPWIESLPEELGVSLPEVVTGRQVVQTAIDNQLPNVPGFLVDDSKGLAQRTALGLVAATAGTPVAVGPDQVAPLGLEVERKDLELDFVGAADAATASQAAEILAPGPGLVESVVGFGQDLIGAVASGIGGGLRAIQRFVTQNPVGRFILTAGFLASSSLLTITCEASVVCGLVAAPALQVAQALIAAEPGEALASVVIAAVLRPFQDFAHAVNSGDPLAIALASANVAATLAPVAGPLIRRLKPQALAIACGLRRMVCISIEEYGPAAQHVADAQRNGSPRLLTLDRTGATARRYSGLRGIATRAGYDRDEYPFALSSQRSALSIRYIDPASNRALGAYVGNQLRGLPDGARFYVKPIA
jgi:YD repeat-containing protein